MRLIIGGYAQGKCDYAMEQYGLGPQDIWDAKTDTLENWRGQRLICHMEALVVQWLAAGQTPLEQVEQWLPKWQDAVIISQEVGCGLVPLSPDERTLREAIGRVNGRLAAAAETVECVMYGLGLTLKARGQSPCGS